MKKIMYLLLFFISSAMADSVVDMCNKSDKICSCAAAVKAEADKRGGGFTKTLSRTNTIGAAHRSAIKSCE